MEEQTKTYEIAYLLTDPTVQETLLKLLNQHGGEVSYQGELKEIKLAYPVQKHTAAHFGFAQFKISPEAVVKYGAALKLQKDVLRIMIISYAPKAVKPVPAASYSKVAAAAPESVKADVEKPKPGEPLSNELLEKKLEEILQ